MKTDVSCLLSTSKEMHEKCEKSGELSLVTKANALHRRAEEKQQEVEVLDREIAERLLATKQQPINRRYDCMYILHIVKCCRYAVVKFATS